MGWERYYIVKVLFLSLTGFVFVFDCNALLCIHSKFAIILKRKRKLVALLLLSYRCVLPYMFCGSSSQCRGLVCTV